MSTPQVPISPASTARWRDRSGGVLLGLAAGDRNGGATESAIRLAESLAERCAFDRDDVLAQYLAWWREGAFDTGPVAALVFERVACGVPVDKAVTQADHEVDGQTAGCNPAHRAAPLAMAAFLSDDVVVDCALREAALTHAHPLAASLAFAGPANYCRLLVQRSCWWFARRSWSLRGYQSPHAATRATYCPCRCSVARRLRKQRRTAPIFSLR